MSAPTPSGICEDYGADHLPAPLTPDDLFAAAGLTPTGTVRWGEPIPEPGPGVYVVSVADPDRIEFDARFEQERAHWLEDQAVVYIGRSRRLARRLRQFYRHAYGDRSPHRGGQAILLLRCDMVIRWAATPDYAGAEHRLLEAFKAQTGRKPFGNRMRSARLC